MDEQQLIKRLRAKDEGAFAEMMARYERQIFACCYSSGLSGSDAEDVASDVFLAVLEAIYSFKGQCCLGTWISTIAYNKIADLIRKRGRMRQLPKEFEVAASDAPADRDDDDIWAAVAQVGFPYGMIIVLFYREDKSIAEIGEIMSMPVNTVKVYLSRAREKLKYKLRAYAAG